MPLCCQKIKLMELRTALELAGWSDIDLSDALLSPPSKLASSKEVIDLVTPSPKSTLKPKRGLLVCSPCSGQLWARTEKRAKRGDSMAVAELHSEKILESFSKISLSGGQK